MTVRGCARLAVYLAATCAAGVAIVIRDTLRDITDACRLPHEFRTGVDDLLAGYTPTSTPYEDVTGRDNLGWR